MQLYAITDRTALARDKSHQCEELVKMTAAWAQGGVDYIQVREKDLEPAELEALVRRIVDAVRAVSADRARPSTRVLVNGTASLAARVAIAGGADGVHLPGGFTSMSIAESIAEVRRGFAPRAAIVSVACHSLSDIEWARDAGADLVLFAPVFGKVVVGLRWPGVGLESLVSACTIAGPMPVFALGGVSAQNARDCIDAGAAGVAGIRLFVDRGWEPLVDQV
ncbi:MAG TPA: thiamine phosphate synthase [Acidisarcina sp.]